MTAKEYLAQAFRLDQRINSKLEQVSRLRNMAMKATGSFQAERISGTKQHSPMESSLVKVIDLEHEINDDIDRLVDLKREIIEVVNSVQPAEYQLVLEMRYLSFMTWEEIADRMCYSWRNVHYVHGKALQRIELNRIWVAKGEMI